MTQKADPSSPVSRRTLILGGIGAAVGASSVAGLAAPSASAAGVITPRTELEDGVDPHADFRRKLDAGTGTIAFVGMSIAGGHGASSSRTKPIERLATKLRKTSRGGVGWMSAYEQYAVLNPRPVTPVWWEFFDPSGKPVDIYAGQYSAYRSNLTGPGRQSVILDGIRIKSAAVTFVGTSADVGWFPGAVGASIDAQYGSAPAVRVVASMKNERTWNTGVAPSASRRITITQATGTIYLEGAYGYDGDEKGTRFIDGTQSGAVAAGFSVASWFKGYAGNSAHADSFARFQPDMFEFMFQTNEYANYVPLADYRTHIYNLLNTYYARYPNASFRVKTPFKPWFDREIPWESYSDVTREAIASYQVDRPDIKVDYVDLGVTIDRNFGFASSEPAKNPYFSDPIHPNDAGYEVIASITAIDWLFPPF